MTDKIKWTKRGLITFMKAQFASQISSLVDFSTTIILANIFSVYYVVATFSGAICGGIVNCIINYKWTFKDGGCRMEFVFIKYTLVWIGSIYLNTYGTYRLTETITANAWVQETLSGFFDNLFIVCKMFVSLMVGFFWNYNLQRSFVYKDRNIKGIIKKRKEKLT